MVYGDEWSVITFTQSRYSFNADKAKTEFNKAKEASKHKCPNLNYL